MIPLSLIKSDFQLIPTQPGIYLYKGDESTVLYVGKAKHLRNRVKSYFKDPHLTPKTRALLSKANFIDFIVVDSDFSALLLEASLINKFKPQYNIISKDDKSPLYILFTDEKFPRVRNVRQTDLSQYSSKSTIFGPFPSSYEAKQLLKKLRHIFPYCESKGDKGKPCLHSHLGLCSPCPRQITSSQNLSLASIYRKNIRSLKSVLSGDTSSVKKHLTQQMNLFSSRHNFEDAAQLRDQIYRLDHLTSARPKIEDYLTNPNLIQDQAELALVSLSHHLGLANSPQRIECYDISHTGKDAATAAMVVAIQGQLKSSEYKHFKIKYTAVPNDAQALKEILIRRLSHPEWGIPELIVLDGGKPQLSACLPVIAQSPFPQIRLISLAKKREEIFFPDATRSIILPPTDPGLRLLVSLRNEAHRFGRRLHHKLRSKAIFS